MLVFLSTCFLWVFSSLSMTIDSDFRVIVYATVFHIYFFVMMTLLIKGGFLALNDGINTLRISLSGSILLLARAIFWFFGFIGNQSTLLGCLIFFFLLGCFHLSSSDHLNQNLLDCWTSWKRIISK